jgi:hypothetical protein
MWHKPFYTLRSHSGKNVAIDVTSSVSAGLPPNKAIAGVTADFFAKKKVRRIVDFGAGALRHVLPLLDAGFEVCAVEFEEQFHRPSCSEALALAKASPNFSALIWPKDFKNDNRRFDAALLCYVLQTMPLPEERNHVLKLIYKKLRDDSYLLWMSRYNQLDDVTRSQRVSDGYYKNLKRQYHSFYREFKTEETHAMMDARKFRRIKSLSERGTDQIFLYGKGRAIWP